MLKIDDGEAKDQGRYWDILDSNGERLTRFSRARFRTICNGAPVYFMDFDIDPTLCDNVQSKTEVDEFVELGTPPGGMEADAEKTLRVFIMDALLQGLQRQGRARDKYHDNLRERLKSMASAAHAPQHRLTMNLLQKVRIAAS